MVLVGMPTSHKAARFGRFMASQRCLPVIIGFGVL
jgi:hypothetical protein